MNSEKEMLEGLWQEHQELNKRLYDLDEQIRDMIDDYHNETDFERKNALKRRRDKRISERDRIEKEIEDIKRKREIIFINGIFQELSMIDCEDHLKQFGNFIKQDNIGAFVIHGCGKYGLMFLLKRILENICLKYRRNPFVIKFDLSSNTGNFSYMNNFEYSTYFETEKIWNGIKSELKNNFLSNEQLISVLSNKWKYEDILLILHGVCSDDLNCIIKKFWFDFSKSVQKKSSETDKLLLLLLIVNDNKKSDECDIRFAGSEEPYGLLSNALIPLPLDRYYPKDLIKWINQFIEKYPVYQESYERLTFSKILEYSGNGDPYLVINCICKYLCEFNLTDGEIHGALREWLKRF